MSEQFDALAARIDRLEKIHTAKFLDTRQAAEFLGFTERGLRQLRYEGGGPPFIKLGSGHKTPVRYARKDLLEWADAQKRFECTDEL